MQYIDINTTNNVCFHCQSGGLHNCSPDWSWQVDRMNDYDLWLVCAGVGQFSCGGKSYDISAGDCFIIPPAAKVSAHHDPSKPLRVISTHFEIVDNNGLPAAPQKPLPFYSRVMNLSFIENIMLRCVKNLLAGRKKQANIWLQAAVLEIVSTQSQSNTFAQNHYLQKINAICEKISSFPHLEYKISDLAASIHVCPDHFNRLFKKQIGISPMEFIINCRIECAKSMLLSSNYPISRIAELSGYKNVYYFSKHFKKITSTTPTKFRNPVKQE